jgi:hypothetical protein
MTHRSLKLMMATRAKSHAVSGKGIANQRSHMKRSYEAWKGDVQPKSMRRKVYISVGSLNTMPQFCLKIHWNPTVQPILDEVPSKQTRQ